MNSEPVPGRGRLAGRIVAEFVALGTLLFVTRFLLRGTFVVFGDQECHIGGIAVDLIEHGLRFPPLAYAPNDYDNSALLSGALTAGSFKLLGQSVLARKLVTHAIATAGSLAGLWLLRTCLTEAGIESKRTRMAAVATYLLLVAFPPAPVVVMTIDAVGDHSEWSAMNVVLLALFAWRLKQRSTAGTAALWAVVGLALYVSKGTLLLAGVMAVAQVAFVRGNPKRLFAACAGFVAGAIPEIYVLFDRHAQGWETILHKGERNARGFPEAWIDSVATLSGHRIELIAVWLVALAFGAMLAWRLRSPAVCLVGAATWMHFGALAVMGQGGMDPYCLYFFVTIVVLMALLVAVIAGWASARWGARPGYWPAIATVALFAVIDRPASLSWGFPRVVSLWHARDAAVCSWRFAEGFLREYRNAPQVPPFNPTGHAIERCRSLVDEQQRDDCIGGIARELHWRHNGKIDGEPPPGMTASERRSFAWHYGIHRSGAGTNCLDFHDADLQRICESAVKLDCLVAADMYTRFEEGLTLGRPHCQIDVPPIAGYWPFMRGDLLARQDSTTPYYGTKGRDGDLSRCRTILDSCY